MSGGFTGSATLGDLPAQRLLRVEAEAAHPARAVDAAVGAEGHELARDHGGERGSRSTSPGSATRASMTRDEQRLPPGERRKRPASPT